jgi:hypothetical protein
MARASFLALDLAQNMLDTVFEIYSSISVVRDSSVAECCQAKDSCFESLAENSHPILLQNWKEIVLLFACLCVIYPSTMIHLLH